MAGDHAEWRRQRGAANRRREVRDLIVQLKQEGKTVFFSTHILSDAEALCDRVAVLHQGELRGVGTVASLTANTQGSVEIVWRGSLIPPVFNALGAKTQITGDTVRAEIMDSRLDAALEALRTEKCPLISVNPVRGTLEEYFMQQMNSANPSAEKNLSQKGASA